MKKVGTILSAFLILILILASGLYFFGVYYFRDWFCPNTYINGTNVSFQRYSVCDDIINNMLITHNLVIEDTDGSVVFIDGDQIYNYDKEQISKAADIIKNSENPYLWPKYIFSPLYYEFKPVSQPIQLDSFRSAKTASYSHSWNPRIGTKGPLSPR